jgi:hypothetical protein
MPAKSLNGIWCLSPPKTTYSLEFNIRPVCPSLGFGLNPCTLPICLLVGDWAELSICFVNMAPAAFDDDLFLWVYVKSNTYLFFLKFMSKVFPIELIKNEFFIDNEVGVVKKLSSLLMFSAALFFFISFPILTLLLTDVRFNDFLFFLCVLVFWMLIAKPT